MREYIKNFFNRGLVAMGFGPIVLAVIYLILGLSRVVNNVSVYEMVIGIFTITLLAFIVGGITVVYQIEELAISKAITIHGLVLYICYSTVYLVNGWLEEGAKPFIIFTLAFFLGFALIWLLIFLITKNRTKQINKNLKF